jgi:hypothetical protein
MLECHSPFTHSNMPRLCRLPKTGYIVLPAWLFRYQLLHHLEMFFGTCETGQCLGPQHSQATIVSFTTSIVSFTTSKSFGRLVSSFRVFLHLEPLISVFQQPRPSPTNKQWDSHPLGYKLHLTRRLGTGAGFPQPGVAYAQAGRCP